jgi:hypothetical protein
MKTNQQRNTIYSPYCYLIGWSKLNKFYYGVRFTPAYYNKCLYHTGCHPDEFWVTYFTSSATVAEYRSLYGEPDIIQIRKTFKTSEAAQRWETKVLRQMLTGPSKEKFLNGNYNGVNVFSEEVRRRMSEGQKGRKLSEETKRKIGESKKGKKRAPFTEEHLRKMGEGQKGKKLSPEHCRMISENHKGRKRPPRTEEYRRKLSKARKGKKLKTPRTAEHTRKILETKAAKRREGAYRAKRTIYCACSLPFSSV